MLARPLIAVAALLSAVGVASTASAAAPVDRGVVDVTTSLRYQGAAAAGTGIVLPGSGDVLTNNHVIRGATTIRVVDPGTGRRYPATVLGYDVSHDVALLRLTPRARLGAVSLGRSSLVKVGDAVTAVGNADGAGGTPASVSGKVTALRRSVVALDEQGGSERLTGLIQFDAALRPGDSGGPLLNAAGKVIGMNTAATRRFELEPAGSVAMAVPIDRAMSIARLIEAGRASAAVHVGPTAFLGVQVAPSTGGAHVVAVVPGSPAAKAGLAPGDVVTELAGHPVSSYATLANLVQHAKAPSVVDLAWTGPDGAARHAAVRLTPGPPQ